MKTRKWLRIMVALLCVCCLAGGAMADTLVLPAGLKKIEEEVFAGTAVNCVIIPEDAGSIGSRAFADNPDLTDIYLPQSDINIAPDAFEEGAQLTFHVYMGTDNASWVTDHGYRLEYISGEAGTPSARAMQEVSELVVSEGSSALQGNKYGTGRLIVKLNTGEELPVLDEYRPKKIIALGNSLYVIQFRNYKDAEDCALKLEAWSGCSYVEADYFLSSADTGDSSHGGVAGNGALSSSDPMGFGAYTESLPDTVGKVTIAIIDNGVTASEVDCTVSSKSYDFIANKFTQKGNAHGTEVAQNMCASFGKLKSHLTIISYNVEDHATGRISYLMMGMAILQAKEDGARYVNISIAGESSYAGEQDNKFLQECINQFGKNRVIAAGPNYASSAKNVIPAKYCLSVTNTKFISGSQTFERNGGATGANYGAVATETSFAAPKVTAAIALVWLDPDSTHKFANTLMDITGDNAKVPILSRLVIRPVEEIILNDGQPLETTFETGDRVSIDYEIRPANATDPQVNVAVEPADDSVIKILSHQSSRVRFSAVGPGSAKLTFTSNDENASPVVVPITVIQPATSVRISGNTDDTVMKDEERPLAVNVLPENASDKGVKWTSSNNNIATVSSKGVVKQVGDGQVTITAISKSNPDIYDSVVMTVSSTPSVADVTVSAAGGIDTLYIGKTVGKVQMSALVLPSGSDQSVTWSVDNTSVATISSSGLLTAVGAGEVVVTATSVSSSKKGYVVMTVVQLPTSISISGSSSVVKDSTITLTANVSPNSTGDKGVTWSSSNTNIATVSSSGVVTGKAAGSVTITATSKADGTVSGQKTISVTILPTSVSVSASSTTMDIGKTLTLSTTVSPSNATDKTLTWSSGDTSIATVSSGGVVTAKAAGSVTITAKTVNGKTGSVTLTVRQPYTLKFNANGGSCSKSSITAYSGYAIGNTLPTPTRDYYEFVGWYTSSSGGTKLTSSWSTTCSTTYNVYAHWTEKPWSDWVDPSAVPTSGVRTETRTEYQYRDKTFSSWSSWTAWSTTREAISDVSLKEESSATVYPWYYYTCANKNCGKHSKVYNTKCTSCGQKIPNNFTWKWTTRAWNVAETESAKVSYTETEYGYGLMFSFSTQRPSNIPKSTTGYRYRTRTSSWGSWSSWSTSVVSSSSTREVKTRTRKRYQYK